jgi:hypothetical protein
MATSRIAEDRSERRAARRRARKREQVARQRRSVVLAAGGIVLVLVLLFALRLLSAPQAAPPEGPLSAETMAAVAGVVGWQTAW